MKVSAGGCIVLVLFAAGAFAADDRSIESMKSDNDVVLTTDTSSSFWQGTRAVYAERDTYGRPLPRYRTEIRSRWTKNNLYFLFICPYDTLYLKPDPDTSTETFRLWNWDVAEVFIGSDFQNIRRYKEFEVSPQEMAGSGIQDFKSPRGSIAWRRPGTRPCVFLSRPSTNVHRPMALHSASISSALKGHPLSENTLLGSLR